MAQLDAAQHLPIFIDQYETQRDMRAEYAPHSSALSFLSSLQIKLLWSVGLTLGMASKCLKVLIT